MLEHPDDAKVTLPEAFLTVTVKTALDDPLTIWVLGVTWICPLLLEVAVIVAEPEAFARFTRMVPEPSLITFNVSGLAFNPHAIGVGDGFGLTDPVGVGEGYGVAVAVGVGEG